MRVLVGSAIAAVVAVVGLFGAITQAGVSSQFANGSISAQIADVDRGPVLAAREGGPAVYGWLYVQPAVVKTDASQAKR